MKHGNILKLILTGILTLFIFPGCQEPPDADEWSDSPKWRDKNAVIRLWSKDMKDASKRGERLVSNGWRPNIGQSPGRISFVA